MPKGSDSIKFSGIAPQIDHDELTTIAWRGIVNPSCRVDFFLYRWLPTKKTEASVSATLFASSDHLFHHE